MVAKFSLFEVSWEVANKVGGVCTAVAGKAPSLVETFGDQYVAVGPWLLSEDPARQAAFQDEPGFEDFVESCRGMGIPVRVGRWTVAGSPRTILVEFSKLIERKDDILAGLWERYNVDSLHGGWDYVEPVLFGHAAGMVLEAWWQRWLLPNRRRAVVQFHEWLTASGMLYLKDKAPSIGSVFTAHATVLGRSLASGGRAPEEGLDDSTPEELAEVHEVRAKHSLEGIAVREADVFTAVSEITAKEAELLHGRQAEPLLPNGLHLEKLQPWKDGLKETEVRRRLLDLASAFSGEDCSDAALLCLSGRYEFHNKGFDVLVDALAKLEDRPGKALVVYVFSPAGNSGVRKEVLERVRQGGAEGSLGWATHNLFDEDKDPLQARCRDRGLHNQPGGRVKLIHVPVYLDGEDALLPFGYEAVTAAMDFSVFPSFYEPWGYGPQESMALGVPTLTTDYAGFGRWAMEQGLGEKQGLTILPRVRVNYQEVSENLSQRIEQQLLHLGDRALWQKRCRKAAQSFSWQGMLPQYQAAYEAALQTVDKRLQEGVSLPHRPTVAISVQESAAKEKPRLTRFDVKATLPVALQGLERLSRNLWWCWDAEARSLFEELSPRGWLNSGHNPVALLQRVFAEDLEARAADPDYRRRLKKVLNRMDAYMAEPAQEDFLQEDRPVAYLCAEYGLHESLPIYSGGLGILAGDHLKSASDLNLPFVAVGLFYGMGYMTQQMTAEGEQVAVDRVNDPRNLPMAKVVDEKGQPLEIRLSLPGREIILQAWRVQVGRVRLYLLDSNLPGNSQEDRDITRHLYGGDAEMRILQEIILGRGGARLLHKLGIQPRVFHLNEGHAAFSSLERVAHLLRDEGLTFEEAREVVRASTVFTTHTPVPAGHDRFGEDLMRRYFSDAPDWVGLPWERFLQLGQTESGGEEFNMTYLALHFAGMVNGVSQMHGRVSQQLLGEYWPRLLTSEVPVIGITNGIHLGTWTDAKLWRALGSESHSIDASAFAELAPAADSQRLWEARSASRKRLLEHVRQVLRDTMLARHDSPVLLDQMLDGLREDALYIGFARRFAPYKRAHLLFQNRERLAKLLNDEKRPARILIAGKAHPRDEKGRRIVQDIVQLARSEEFAGKVLFLEDYNIALGRSLVQGVDVWLNNPTRLQEASGTSGMKAAANGGLNLSIGDGWWPEAFDGRNGWQIAGERVYQTQELQDQFDAAALYRLLEEEVLPLFFNRDADGIPQDWLEMVRHALATIPALFNTDRMVAEYRDRAYLPLARRGMKMTEGDGREVRRLAGERQRIRKGFQALEIVGAELTELQDLKVGDRLQATVDLRLGELKREDVRVEILLGHVKEEELDLQHAVVQSLSGQALNNGTVRYSGNLAIDHSGSYACGLRVRAGEDELQEQGSLELIRWL
ncbi:MAG: alpha-glucan family phosphorylase [Planctomycetota bacterium]|nr:MAG: alpha-glucan family phosphorylase [Planctomycetota bacterium]